MLEEQPPVVQDLCLPGTQYLYCVIFFFSLSLLGQGKGSALRKVGPIWSQC